MVCTELCVLTNMYMIYDGDYVLVQNHRKFWPSISFLGDKVRQIDS